VSWASQVFAVCAASQVFAVCGPRVGVANFFLGCVTGFRGLWTFSGVGKLFLGQSIVILTIF